MHVLKYIRKELSTIKLLDASIVLVLTTPYMYCVYVIAQEGVKFGIHFTSCSEDGNETARGAAEFYFAVIAKTSGIYPKISLLPVLSQINTIASFVKVKISYFQTRFHYE